MKTKWAMALLTSGWIVVPSVGSSAEQPTCIPDAAAYVAYHEGSRGAGTTQFALDLDAKGLILFVASNSLMDNGSGPFHAFQLAKTCYMPLGTLFLSPSSLQVLKSTHHGLRDIKSYSPLSVKSGMVSLYRFDGTAYQRVSQKEIKASRYSKEIQPTQVATIRSAGL